MKTIDEVKVFLEEFIEKEYNLYIDQYKLVGSRDDYIDKVYDLFDEAVLFSAKHTFNGLTAWSDGDSVKERESYINDILRKRKIFAIEEYKNTKLDSSIKDEGFSNNVFVCYVSHNHESSNHRYFKRFFIAEADSNLKIIATERPSEDGWREVADYNSIKNIGEFVQAKKVQAPADEEDLWHYNSL
ncbi:hypothetical protein [Microscilla marina]|uniref:Uncharacterized protein n=1 Tax=Microscilla marina ATCC 23134 TaxID=313606 RepID=A1ZZZ4_MICM2|nr:hypothetical protein [Microscilla marina]EAY24036.1 hypothetical protein M23134_00928 [Microscilla marina ATCC 23134]